MTVVAIGSLALSHLGDERVDAVFGIVVALLIARTGYQILRDSIPMLVDGDTSGAAAHDFTDEVERAIARELGAAEAIVHVEPA